MRLGVAAPWIVLALPPLGPRRRRPSTPWRAGFVLVARAASSVVALPPDDPDRAADPRKCTCCDARGAWGAYRRARRPRAVARGPAPGRATREARRPASALWGAPEARTPFPTLERLIPPFMADGVRLVTRPTRGVELESVGDLDERRLAA